MDEREWLTERFEQHRPRLRAVAYRMLGSTSDADDALQEAWLRVRDHDPVSVENMQAWLATVVGRDPVVTLSDAVDPEQETLLADSVGLALLVVLDALAPAERLAFVLHDVFGVPFADIATALDRSEAAAQQLASRARRRVRDAPEPDRDLARQRPVVDAFFAASRDGDFDALLDVLDPDVELRIDGGVLRAGDSLVLHGADAVAAHTTTYSKLYAFVRPALVNGAAGAIVAPRGRLFCVMGFAVSAGRITAIDALADPERLAQLELDLRGG
jgi:RNA polymerase sigma-70 factor (ECF subfamily)